MAWAIPKYSREQINRAAKHIVATADPWADGYKGWRAYADAIEVVNNWRASHAY